MFYESIYFWLVIVGVIVLGVGLWTVGRFPQRVRSILRGVDRRLGPITVVLGVLVAFTGFLTFAFHESTRPDAFSVALYETIQLYSFNVDTAKFDGKSMSGWAMVFAVLLAVTLGAKGIVLLFHGSYVAMRISRLSGHVVICGLGRIGRQLVEDLTMPSQGRRKVVIVEPDAENRDLVWASDRGAYSIIGDATQSETLKLARVHKASEVFLVAGRDECNVEAAIELRDILRNPPVDPWEKLWELLRRLWPWGKKDRAAIRCHVHVLDRDLAASVRSRSDDLEDSSASPLSSDSALVESEQSGSGGAEKILVDVEVFSVIERTVQRLLADLALFEFDGKPIRPVDESEVAHFVMIGFGSFGQTLALQLAEQAHFENGKRLRMTIIDTDIEKKARKFIARHPRFGPDINDIAPWKFDRNGDEWTSKRYRPIEQVRLPDEMSESGPRLSRGIEYVCNAQYIEDVEVTGDAFLEEMERCFESAVPKVKPAILVCYEDDLQNFATAERLREKLKTRGKSWPIFVWIPRQKELSQLLRRARQKDKAGATRELIPFGQCYGSVSYEEINDSWSEWLAKVFPLMWIDPKSDAYTESVRQLSKLLETLDPNAWSKIDWKMLDQEARSGWEGLDEWERASNRSAAIHAVVKAAFLRCRIDGLCPLASAKVQNVPFTKDKELPLLKMEHYRWVAERLLSGWRYGPLRSKDRKTRWQIVSWDGLNDPPEEAKAEMRQKRKKQEEEWTKQGKDPKEFPEKQEQEKDAAIVRMLLGAMWTGRLAVTRARNPHAGASS